ncbi:MAG: hypothetical protein C4326_05400 [Ignavibacteria bacterium]
MKRMICIVMFAASVHAETPEQFFDLANQAYQQGMFAEAIEKYEMILQSGLVSGELYYNLGNAYYKAGNIGKAILNYERARRMLPNDDDVLHNLQLVNLMIADRIEPLPRVFLWDWWDGITSWFSMNGITWTMYGVFLLTLVAGAAFMLAPTYALRRAAFIGVMVGVILFVGMLSVFLGKLGDLQRSDIAIVTADVATLKNSPDPKSTDAFVLHSGVKVFITDKVKGWLKVRLADGKVAWIEQNTCEVI